MKKLTSTLFASAILVSSFGMASFASAAGLFPSALLDNSTGTADSAFLGAPDGNSGNVGTNWIGIGGQIVTYDFGFDRVVNGTGSDFNVYEVNYGAVEFSSITVSASLDGTNFFDLTSSQSAWVDIDGDEAHGAPSFAQSYDLDGFLSEARYIRIDGDGTGSAGGTTAFDLDAIGAINFTVAAVPLPAGLPLLIGGVAAMAGLRRKKRS